MDITGLSPNELGTSEPEHFDVVVDHENYVINTDFVLNLLIGINNHNHFNHLAILMVLYSYISELLSKVNSFIENPSTLTDPIDNTNYFIDGKIDIHALTMHISLRYYHLNDIRNELEDMRFYVGINDHSYQYVYAIYESFHDKSKLYISPDIIARINEMKVAAYK